MALKLLGPAATLPGDAPNKAYVDGAIRSTSVSISANNRDVVLANASGGSITIGVPVAAGARVLVKKTDASVNSVVVTCAGTVDGDASAILLGQDTAAVFIGDGTNVQIEAVYAPGAVDSYYQELNLAGQSVLTNTVTAIVGASSARLLGNHASAWNLATGVWTCPVSGFYKWTASLAFTAWVNGSRVGVYLERNANATGNAFLNLDIAASNANGRITGSAGKYFAAGDTVHCDVVQYTGSTQVISTGDQSYISTKLVT